MRHKLYQSEVKKGMVWYFQSEKWRKLICQVEKVSILVKEFVIIDLY